VSPETAAEAAAAAAKSSGDRLEVEFRGTHWLDWPATMMGIFVSLLLFKIHCEDNQDD